MSFVSLVFSEQGIYPRFLSGVKSEKKRKSNPKRQEKDAEVSRKSQRTKGKVQARVQGLSVVRGARQIQRCTRPDAQSAVPGQTVE